jgi:predicted dehydrogenase
MYLPAVKKHPDAELVCICGRNYDRVKTIANRWNIPCTYTDYRQMLTSGMLDAVIVASSNVTHYPITMLALEQGLHVLCEKPLALHAADAYKMAEKARAVGVKNMVPFTYRWMPTTRYAKQLIDEGYIGKPYHLAMRYYTGYGRSGEYRSNFDRSIGGDAGVIAEIGAHWLYLARWFYGEISAITCYADALIERGDQPGKPVPDSAVMTVRFVSGAYGVLHVSTVCLEGTEVGGQNHFMEFHGAGGTLYNHIDWDRKQALSGIRPGGKLSDISVPESIWEGVRRDTVHNTYRDIFRERDHMTREFISAIVEQRPNPKPDFEDGARVQALIDAAVRSAEANACLVEV